MASKLSDLKPKRSSKGTNFRIATLIREGSDAGEAAAQAHQEAEANVLRKRTAKRVKALGR